MGDDAIAKGTQLEFAAIVAPSSRESPKVWLLSASPDDANSFRRTLRTEHARPAAPFLFLDMETGASPIAPDDLILLKTSDHRELDLFVPPAFLAAHEIPHIVLSISSAFRSPATLSEPRATLDLGLLRFVGNAKRDNRKGWSRSRLEMTLDTLLCRGIAGNPGLSARLCDELLADADVEQTSILRAMALRMRADSLSQSIASEPERRAVWQTYLEAQRAFTGAGIDGQAAASGRLGSRLHWDTTERQLQFWATDQNEAVSPLPSLGFHLRRFTGMRLPVRPSPWARLETAPGPLRHVWATTLKLDTTSLAQWIAGTKTCTPMATLLADEREFADGSRFVDFVIDSELAVRAGLAGKSLFRTEQRSLFRLIPTSATCRLEPTYAQAEFGRSARFKLEPSKGKVHDIDLMVLTPDAAPTSISFRIRP
jgi:hypothetical protein